MFLQEGSIFPSPPNTVLLSVTTHSHNTRLKFHTELLILAPWIQASLKTSIWFRYGVPFWQPDSHPRLQFRWQQLFCTLQSSFLWTSLGAHHASRSQCAVLSHKATPLLHKALQKLQERGCIYMHKYQFIDIEGAITSWPKVIAAMFLCAICLFQSLLKKQPLTNSHINPSAHQTLPNLLLLEAIAVVDLNPRPSSSRKLLCIRNTCKSLVDCAQKCWEQQTFSSDQ